MRKNEKKKSEGILIQMKECIEYTDIRVLVFTPFIFAFGLIIVWIISAPELTKGELSPPQNYVVIGISILITSLSGYFEIYKKEMPGPFGNIIHGKIAIISGILMILFSGFLGGIMLFYGITGFSS